MLSHQSIADDEINYDQDIVNKILDENEKIEKEDSDKNKENKKNGIDLLKEKYFSNFKEFSLELGYMSEHGNTDSSTINTKINYNFIKNSHKNTGELRYVVSEEDGEEDKNQSSLNIQHSYKIKRDVYWYANISFFNTKYSSYFKDYSTTTGFGYNWNNIENLNINTELGFGYRYQEPNLDEIDYDDLIFPNDINEAVLRANFDLNYKITKTL